MHIPRCSGVLLHPTSLPGPYGIGGLGKAAYEFVDFLAAAGQSYWQILPHCPVSRAFDCSPYMGLSAFAGNPLLIDPDALVEDGLLDRRDLVGFPSFSEYLVDFDAVLPAKMRLLAAAFQTFSAGAPGMGFEQFCRSSPWLADYALFCSLREEFSGRPWQQWPPELFQRQPEARKHWTAKLARQISFHKFVQFCFFSQWQRLRQHVTKQGIGIIGDIPIYVALDSADVWVNQNCFLLDPATGQPTAVAGVPPDYFSKTGQRWGNPLFRWENSDGRPNQALLRWWARRLAQTFQVVDLVRIDHFRGFEAFWQIPANEKTAIKGEWVKGPGLGFFRAMEKQLGSLAIIAEDLGLITPEVEALRESLGFPGMKILQFAFDSDEQNAYLPHNYPNSNCLVYTGTHDNDTTLGWYLSEQASQSAKDRILRYAGERPGSQIHHDFIRMAYASVAALAVIPLQDILGFGSDCRMNLPGTAKGNWRWRCAARFLSDNLAKSLRDEVVFYNRLPPGGAFTAKGDDKR